MIWLERPTRRRSRFHPSRTSERSGFGRAQPGARCAWGEDDYEATLEIRPEHLGGLTLLLLQAGFGGQGDALEQLRIFCERRGVPHRLAVWT
jgi:hypothetical protein